MLLVAAKSFHYWIQR